MFKEIFGNLPKFLEKTFLLSNSDKKLSKPVQVFLTCYFFVVLLFGFYSIYLTGLEKSLDGPSAFLSVAGIITSSHTIFSLVNQRTIKELLNIFGTFQDRRKEEWEKKIFEKESKSTWKIMYYYSMGMLGYNIFNQIFPLAADTIVGLLYPRYHSMRVPLFAQGFIDMTEPRSAENFVLSMVSVTWNILGVIGHIGGQAMILVSLTYMKIELLIIKQKIYIIKDLFMKRGGRSDAKKFLKDVITHHYMTINGLNVMNKALGFPIAAQSATVSICFCLNLYGIFSFADKTSSHAKSQGVTANLLLLFNLYRMCSSGESLEDVNNEIYDGIYDLPWYDEDVDTRKTLIMMLRQANVPFVVNFHQIMHLKLQNFMQVVNTSYSYFMMLSSII